MTIRKFGKVGVLFLALVLALGGIGAAFAAWTDTLTISGDVTTGELEWEMMGPITNADPPLVGSLDWNCFFDLETGTWEYMDKDVASTTVVIVDSHTMTVTVDNAYPYYGNHIAFKFHGLGSIPLRFWKINIWSNDTLVATWYAEDQYVELNLDGEGGNDLELWWGDHLGWQFHFCTKADVSFEFLVLQPAPQDDTLEFTMEFVGIQWNEYTAGPLP